MSKIFLKSIKIFLKKFKKKNKNSKNLKNPKKSQKSTKSTKSKKKKRKKTIKNPHNPKNLQSSPFQNPGGSPLSLTEDGQKTDEILVSNIQIIYGKIML